MEKRTILQGEVYVCELDGIDSEQRGEKLCIVLQLDIINRTSPNVIIVPITSKHKKDMPTHLTFTIKDTPHLLLYSLSLIKSQIILLQLNKHILSM